MIAKVLLVDDDPRYLDLLEELLTDAGLETARAGSAGEALTSIGASAPDLVISDIQMPGVTGPDLRRCVRTMPAARRLPFVFVTGDEKGGAASREVHPVVRKQDGADAVVNRVNRVLALRRARKRPESAPRPVASPARVAPRSRAIPSEVKPVPREGIASGLARLAASIERASYPVCKRALDITLGAIGLVLLAPLFALVAAAIKLEDRGPVLYARPRVGLGGRHFPFYKFRSMSVDAEARRAALVGQSDDGDPVRFKMRRDPRITRVGRWIRRLSIDELPQLWNVLRGDMSLVGPRPPIPEEVARYGPVERRRLEVPPGITCTWQVSGRADIPFPRQVELDLAYIRERSLLLDLGLLLRTIPAVLTGRGAY